MFLSFFLTNCGLNKNMILNGKCKLYLQSIILIPNTQPMKVDGIIKLYLLIPSLKVS